ncbi:hypothetical protein [Natranaerofaba carboxydovora]|uniref:hypothetical protein n=1 Tax=Natranaerofaba carboxydovora TaxID=2742683 RepID=UPI001F142863|nr:hypothetical protein [Natranaerofaba carboxydovora]UMZ74242.1 hypothetical protein ACONDI_01828 [Natranaerofaba carboxydovora]
MEMTLPVLFFLSIPEMIALSLFVLALNKSLNYWKKGVIVGVFLALTVYCLRLIPITFGVHTLILISLSVTIFFIVFNLNLIKTILSVLLGQLIIIIGEFFSIVIIPNRLGISNEDIFENSVLWITFGWFSVILVIIVTFIIYKFTLR